MKRAAARPTGEAPAGRGAKDDGGRCPSGRELAMLVGIVLLPVLVVSVVIAQGDEHATPTTHAPKKEVEDVAETRARMALAASRARTCPGGVALNATIPYFSQSGEDHALYKKFYKTPAKCNGVILEMGALDGRMLSNSHFFEKALNWTAILIEADPENFKELKKNRPDAIVQYGAVCEPFNADGSPATLKFARASHPCCGGAKKTMSAKQAKAWIKMERLVEVPCISLKDLLKRHGIKHIDVFSLDVEGGELEVLQQMDWGVRVEHWMVEVLDATEPGGGDSSGRTAQIMSLMEERGYSETWDYKKYCEHQDFIRDKFALAKAARFPFATSLRCMSNKIFEPK